MKKKTIRRCKMYGKIPARPAEEYICAGDEDCAPCPNLEECIEHVEN
jgi:hypothetical protein